jgi:dsDNA-binding SOS-regulon protein
MKMPEYINFSKYRDIWHSKWVWPSALTVSAVLIALLFAADLNTPLRPILALWFLLVCPGMSIVRIFDVQELLLEWVLAIALSISLAGIVSAIMIYTATWSPALGLWILIAITLLGVIVQTLLDIRIIVWPISEVSVPLDRYKRNEMSVPLADNKQNELSVALDRYKRNELSVSLDEDKQNEIGVPLATDKRNEMSVPPMKIWNEMSIPSKNKQNEISVPLATDKRNEMSIPLAKNKQNELSVPLDDNKQKELSVPLAKNKRNKLNASLAENQQNEQSVPLKRKKRKEKK